MIQLQIASIFFGSLGYKSTIVANANPNPVTRQNKNLLSGLF